MAIGTLHPCIVIRSFSGGWLIRHSFSEGGHKKRVQSKDSGGSSSRWLSGLSTRASSSVALAEDGSSAIALAKADIKKECRVKIVVGVRPDGYRDSPPVHRHP